MVTLMDGLTKLPRPTYKALERYVSQPVPTDSPRLIQHPDPFRLVWLNWTAPFRVSCPDTKRKLPQHTVA